MAALAASAVSLYPGITPSATVSRPSEWPVNYPGSGIITRSLKITSLAQGDATDTIGAAALGLTTILSTSNLWDATNSKGYPAVVDPVNNIIILLDGAADPTPKVVTAAAAYITVTGSVKAASAT